MPPNFLTKHYRILYGLVTLVAILLIVASHYWIPDNVFRILAKELGFAGIIAVILVFTIETFNRERHQLAADELLANINKNIFYAIYKRYVPEAVFEEVEKCVMMCTVYRESHELDYTIDEFAGGAEPDLKTNYFQCTAQTSYKITNLLDQETQHDVKILIERPIESKYDPLCAVEAVAINGAHLSPAELELCKSWTESHLIFSKTISLSAREKVEITTKSILIKKKTDSEIWCSRLPSDGLKLTVSTPSKGLVVQATSNHSEPLKNSLANPVTSKWVLDFGIFPHQSIVFWWKPA